MHNQEGLKLLFVVNPVSGGKEKHDWEASIREYLREKPHRPEFYLLTGNNDKPSIQHHIDTLAPDRVVAVGGDGTVRMLTDMLKETSIPLGIIPAGSANGMAKELEIPKDVTLAMDIVTGDHIRKLDLIRINEEEISIHLSDIGLNAMLVKYFEKSKKRGMWGYGQAVARVLWEKRKLRVTLCLDEGEVKRLAYMVVLANARKYGTGANINPEGDVADGKFEVVVVRKLNVLEMVKAVFTEKPFHPRRIEVFRTANLEMSIQNKAYFQIDGEFKGKVSKVTARILPRIVNVMVPENPA